MPVPTPLPGLILVLTGSFFAPGCGGPLDLRGVESRAHWAMKRGDTDAAVGLFDQARARLELDDPDYAPVTLSLCWALSGVDPARAQAEFLALTGTHPLEIRDYTSMAGRLARYGSPHAIQVLEAGQVAFPEAVGRLAELIEEVRGRWQLDHIGSPADWFRCSL